MLDKGIHSSFYTRMLSCWLAPVRFYRNYISPLKSRPSCRYLPTCSEYAIEAVDTHGIFLGTAKSLWRIARCNPFVDGGYDPVSPQERSKE